MAKTGTTPTPDAPTLVLIFLLAFVGLKLGGAVGWSWWCTLAVPAVVVLFAWLIALTLVIGGRR